MEKVTSIRGVFIKAKDVKSLAGWYQKHLGIEFGNNSYVDFKWLNKDSNLPGNTMFSFFKEDSTYFNPSRKPFMINFRVKDLEGLLEELKKEGVEVVGDKEEYEYGKFGWIINPEGNKIELWQPVNEIVTNKP